VYDRIRRMYRYDVQESAAFVVATFEGDVTDSDFFDYLSHMLSHTRYGIGWRSLLDLTKATGIHLTTGGVQRMRALPLYMEERLSGARAAILVSEGSAAYDLVRMYETMGRNAKYRVVVFTERDKAMEWLSSNPGDRVVGDKKSGSEEGTS
jgi:hypothetical protein